MEYSRYFLVKSNDDSAEAGALSLEGAVIRSSSTDKKSVISHLRDNIAAKYPPHLFPLQTFRMQDGWIIGPNNELFLWVPPVNRSGLSHPSARSRIMGNTHITELDSSVSQTGYSVVTPVDYLTPLSSAMIHLIVF